MRATNGHGHIFRSGSQLPLEEPLTDARSNVLRAVIFAGRADLTEVCVFFNSSVALNFFAFEIKK